VATVYPFHTYVALSGSKAPISYVLNPVLSGECFDDLLWIKYFHPKRFLSSLSNSLKSWKETFPDKVCIYSRFIAPGLHIHEQFDESQRFFPLPKL
jgi:hypothetical protein